MATFPYYPMAGPSIIDKTVGSNRIAKDLWRCGSCPPQTVFDLKGNSFRIIAGIDYETQTIQVTHVLTHAEYDKENWKRK